jgi:hypothetical protein
MTACLQKINQGLSFKSGVMEKPLIVFWQAMAFTKVSNTTKTGEH